MLFINKHAIYSYELELVASGERMSLGRIRVARIKQCPDAFPYVF